MKTPLSLLDLASVQQGKAIPDAFSASVQLASKAETLGFSRFWMAEHHNMAGIASAATAVILAHVAGATKTIRVGAGGIMLPNHAPLVIAEQFGTLESLFPGRVDLGLGRAPGTDRATMRALRRDQSTADDFPALVRELQGYFAEPAADQKISAIPGVGLKIPLWILGSSLFSAQLAAGYGLPYAFAGHFAPDQMLQALELYHREFRPSRVLDRPRTIVCVQAVAADTNERADFLATTLYQRFLGIIRNQRTLSPPPTERMDWSPEEQDHIKHTFRFSLIGGPGRVKEKLDRIKSLTRADEIMVCAELYGLPDRLRSLEILAEVAGD